jgi:hypothetical protein
MEQLAAKELSQSVEDPVEELPGAIQRYLGVVEQRSGTVEDLLKSVDETVGKETEGAKASVSRQVRLKVLLRIYFMRVYICNGIWKQSVNYSNRESDRVSKGPK